MAYSIPNMLLRGSLLFLCLTCVRPTEDTHNNVREDHVSQYHKQFSLWPSMHNAARVQYLRSRRDMQEQNAQVQTEVQVGHSEGGVVLEKKLTNSSTPTNVGLETQKTNITREKVVTEIKIDKQPNITEGAKAVEAVSTPLLNTTKTAVNNSSIAKNSTETKKTTEKQIDLNNPDVLKRGFIVFGGFAILAVAYFIFYKWKSKKNESNNNQNGTNETNQFRYGVLMSEDRRDNMELSRVPLTMESDDDEEEDLEIFDLEQKKKSLSYVNLPLNDEDVVLSRSDNRDERDNLLLDIEDVNSDALINWSSNSNNKSIL